MTEERDSPEHYLAYASTLRASGEYADALEYAERARSGAAALGNLRVEVRATIEVAMLLKMNDRPAAALTHLNWVITLARGKAQHDLEPVAWHIARSYILYVDAAEGVHDIDAENLLDVLDLGEEFVRQMGRPDWRDGLLNMRASVYFDLGRRDEALACLQEAVDVSRTQTGPSPAFDLATHLRALADAYREFDRYDDAIAVYEQLVDEGAPLVRLAALCGMGRAYLGLDRPDEAVFWAERALPLTETMFPRQRAAPLGLLVDAYRAAGRTDEAAAAAKEVFRIAQQTGSKRTLCYAHLDLADVAMDAGRWDEAREHLDAAAPLAELLDARTRLTEAQDEVRERVERWEGARHSPR